jgi:hypothetical protein
LVPPAPLAALVFFLPSFATRASSSMPITPTWSLRHGSPSSAGRHSTTIRPSMPSRRWTTEPPRTL